jgi:hypothetical protein|tara:strand:- start:623 stop:826 length:204 start_codon:yes stop_codon:yes gene_type:complete
MTILDVVKIKNMLDDLINGNAITLTEFKFRIDKMGCVVQKLVIQTSTTNTAQLIIKDNNNKTISIEV